MTDYLYDNPEKKLYTSRFVENNGLAFLKHSGVR